MTGTIRMLAVAIVAAGMLIGGFAVPAQAKHQAWHAFGLGVAGGMLGAAIVNNSRPHYQPVPVYPAAPPPNCWEYQNYRDIYGRWYTRQIYIC